MTRSRAPGGLAALPICVLLALPAAAEGLSAAGRGAAADPLRAAPEAGGATARISPAGPRRPPRRPPRPPREPEDGWLSNTPDGSPEQRGCWWRPRPGAEWRWTCTDRRGYGIGYYGAPDYWLYDYVERHRARRDAAAAARAQEGASAPAPDPVPPPPDDHPWVTRGQTREAGQDGIRFVAPPE